MCLGNTENLAGSDVAGISMTADKVDGGWVLNGTKAYVTNGYIADLGVITAVSDPAAARNSRLSMYLVDLNAEGVSRKKLNKQVWIPSDLTRLKFDNVFVPQDHLLGGRHIWCRLSRRRASHPQIPHGHRAPPWARVPRMCKN